MPYFIARVKLKVTKEIEIKAENEEEAREKLNDYLPSELEEFPAEDSKVIEINFYLEDFKIPGKIRTEL